MNVIKVKIDFKDGTNTLIGNSLISGDYASTKLEFIFDTEEGTKIFEMKNPQEETVIVKEIENDELLLVGIDEHDNYYSLFDKGGLYTYEISLYDNGTKLTSAYGEIPVMQEQVIVDGEVVEPYLPVFEELLQDVSEALTQMNNWNISATKSEGTTTISITNKDNETSTTYVYDGVNGQDGRDGTNGQDGVDGQDATINGYNTLTIEAGNNITIEQEGSTMTISSSGGSGGTSDYTELSNKPKINNVELGGNKTLNDLGIQPSGDYLTSSDLTDYVTNTDYASSSKGGVIKANSIFGTEIRNYGNHIGNITALTKTYTQYQDSGNDLLIGKGTLENVLNGKGFATIPTLTGTQQSPIILSDLQEGYITIRGYYSDSEEMKGYDGSYELFNVSIYSEGANYHEKNVYNMYGFWCFVDEGEGYYLDTHGYWADSETLQHYATKTYVDTAIGTALGGSY